MLTHVLLFGNRGARGQEMLKESQGKECRAGAFFAASLGALARLGKRAAYDRFGNRGARGQEMLKVSQGKECRAGAFLLLRWGR